MESNGEVVADWNTYCVAADGCLKAGIMEMAMTMLKKLEGQITEKTKSIAFDTLLKLYSRKGNKDELYRIWKPDEKRDKIYNKGYMSMISSLLMLDDIEAAEMMFKEWESRELSYYFRVPNILINAYCRNNLLEKAESLIDHAMMKGSEPSADAWYSLASGYLEVNQIPMAKETHQGNLGFLFGLFGREGRSEQS
jgi:pentatricopeptide repeat protein